MSVLAPPETNRPQSAVTMETDTSMLEKEATARSTPVDSVHDEKPAMTEIAEVPEQEKDLTRIQTHESAIEYPKKLQLALITLALCLAVFLFALDQTIIATAIPRITDQFNSLDDVGWYGSSYLLATCACQLLFGKFYKLFGIKTVYLVSIGIFELGSLICAIAQNSLTLIMGRAVAGVGCAGLFSGSLIIVAYTVPLHQRPTYTGAITSMYGIASVAGPLMGGAFTTHATWRWCFAINLPIGAVTILIIIFFFKAPGKQRVASTQGWKAQIAQFDPYGTAVFLPAIICLLLALSWGGSKYEWGNARIIALFVLFGIFATTFAIIQVWQGENATIPLRILKQRSVLSATFYSLCLGASFLLFIYYLPIWFQAIKGVTALKSGILNLPMILTLIIMSIVAGATVTIFGYYTPAMYLSAILSSVGAGLITTFSVNTGHAKYLGYQALYGLGTGIGMQQPLMAVQTVLSLSDVPTGTSIVIFAQTLGGALFISIAQNVFSNKLASGLASSVPGLDPSIVLKTGATNLKDVVPDQYYHAVLVAYNAALTHTYYVAVAMSTLSIIGALGMEWKSVKGQKPTVTAA